jgi:uncharacterized protein YggE
MMNKKWIALLIGMLAVFALAACGVAPQAIAASSDQTQPPRTISVSGTGTVKLVPDIAYVYIGVQSQNENVAAALSSNNEKAQAVSQKLQALGIDAKDIQTSGFNIYPNQQYTPDGQPKATTYMVDNTVNVTVRDLSVLGKLLDQVVSAGANSINGITFDVVDRSKAEAEARKLAVTDARAQADELAQAAGVQIDQLQTLNVSTSTGPVLYDAKGGMAAAPSAQVPVSAGQLSIQVNVSITYTIK